MTSGRNFLATWAGPVDDVVVVSARIDDLYHAARRGWPAVELALPSFATLLARHADPALDPVTAITALRSDDLYLAGACVHGDPGASAAFAVFDPDIRGALRRLRLDAATVDDLAQGLRERLFLGVAGGPPKLDSYAGRGSLRSWVRTAATRHGLNFIADRREAAPLTETVLLGLRSTGDAALDVFKQRYRAQFRDALADALRALSARDRMLLAQYFIDELTVDEIAAIHGTHRATAARWVARARGAVLEATTAQLRATLRVDGAELDSILRWIASQLDASLGALVSSVTGTVTPPSGSAAGTLSANLRP